MVFGGRTHTVIRSNYTNIDANFINKIRKQLSFAVLLQLFETTTETTCRNCSSETFTSVFVHYIFIIQGLPSQEAYEIIYLIIYYKL